MFQTLSLALLDVVGWEMNRFFPGFSVNALTLTESETKEIAFCVVSTNAFVNIKRRHNGL